MKEDVSHLLNEEWQCDDCKGYFPLNIMRGGHSHLQCDTCWKKPSKEPTHD